MNRATYWTIMGACGVGMAIGVSAVVSSCCALCLAGCGGDAFGPGRAAEEQEGGGSGDSSPPDAGPGPSDDAPADVAQQPDADHHHRDGGQDDAQGLDVAPPQEAGVCSCVEVPSGWTLVEGTFSGLSCDGSFQGGTATYCASVGAPAVFSCLPSSTPPSCEVGGTSPAAPSPGRDLCLQQAGDVPCPASGPFSTRHTVYAPIAACAMLANPTTLCCNSCG